MQLRLRTTALLRSESISGATLKIRLDSHITRLFIITVLSQQWFLCVGHRLLRCGSPVWDRLQQLAIVR